MTKIKELSDMVDEIERMVGIYKRVENNDPTGGQVVREVYSQYINLVIEQTDFNFAQYINLVIEQTDFNFAEKSDLRHYWRDLIKKDTGGRG